uniref:protein Aster-C isoform X2 n=1 Tax=Doryrhamphus excisus TaxID=161450 RepID=UPI0025AE8DC6|nr:protein Aster-C isoform X2 [Doryrhamphus excisus]
MLCGWMTCTCKQHLSYPREPSLTSITLSAAILPGHPGSSKSQSTSEQMDRVPNRPGVGSSDTANETTSLLCDRSSVDGDDESSETQVNCTGNTLPTYQHRCDELRKLFKEVPDSERLLVDYPCALHRDILLQGRLYLTDNWLCFYSVFRATKIALFLKDIEQMTKEKTARLFPNAIVFCTKTERLFLASFSAREKSYLVVFRMWQNALLGKTLTSQEFCQMVKQHYGSEALSHEEMESLQLTAEFSMQSSVDGGDDSLPRPETSTPQENDVTSPSGSFTEDPRSSSPFPDRNPNGVSEESVSESVDEEDRVGLSQEQGRLYLNKVFHMSAGRMFDLLFTDSPFIRRFMNVRKITDPSFTAWQEDTTGNSKRSLNYTITISNPLIGKFSTATENQTLYKESQDGHFYLVDSEVYTHDVPYHDYFYTQNRYYIRRHSKHKCRLKVYTDVKYKKQPWGLIKSFITKNSWNGIEDYFRELEAELLEEEAEITQGSVDSGQMGGRLRRRRHTYGRISPEHMKPNKQVAIQRRDGPAQMNSPHRWNIPTIVAGMSVILLILTVVNVGLFCKLWAMEDVAHRMYLTTKHRLRERSEASVVPEYGSRPDPAYMTREEAQLLKTVLQDSISLLEQLRSSLVLLQQNFALANQTAVMQ